MIRVCKTPSSCGCCARMLGYCYSIAGSANEGKITSLVSPAVFARNRKLFPREVMACYRQN